MCAPRGSVTRKHPFSVKQSETLSGLIGIAGVIAYQIVGSLIV
jgi:hypothetical protein